MTLPIFRATWISLRKRHLPATIPIPSALSRLAMNANNSKDVINLAVKCAAHNPGVARLLKEAQESVRNLQKGLGVFSSAHLILEMPLPSSLHCWNSDDGEATHSSIIPLFSNALSILFSARSAEASGCALALMDVFERARRAVRNPELPISRPPPVTPQVVSLPDWLGKH